MNDSETEYRANEQGMIVEEIDYLDVKTNPVRYPIGSRIHFLINPHTTNPHALRHFDRLTLRPRIWIIIRLSKDISVHPRRVNEIVHGKRSITAGTALRLDRYFRMSPQFWLNLQSRYDLEVTEDLFEDRLDKEVRVFKACAA